MVVARLGGTEQLSNLSQTGVILDKCGIAWWKACGCHGLCSFCSRRNTLWCCCCIPQLPKRHDSWLWLGNHVDIVHVLVLHCSQRDRLGSGGSDSLLPWEGLCVLAPLRPGGGSEEQCWGHLGWCAGRPVPRGARGRGGNGWLCLGPATVGIAPAGARRGSIFPSCLWGPSASPQVSTPAVGQVTIGLSFLGSPRVQLAGCKEGRKGVMDEELDGWMDGRTGGWTDGWMAAPR